MKIIHTEQYDNDGRKYEIRLYGSAWEFTVQAFINGKRANGYSYSVSLPTAIDLNTVHRLDAVKVLMDAAKRDIADRVWKQYLTPTSRLFRKPRSRLSVVGSAESARSRFQSWMNARCMSAASVGTSGTNRAK